MLTPERRYDIDWIRVIAIALLLLYHVAIGFQRWGIMIGFIATDKPWDGLWLPMSMLNIWRIPLLFFVSGMGVYFAIRNRNWKQLLLERSSRILLPLLFGIFAIVPLHVFLWQYYYNFDPAYNPNPGHLWFLGNIFLYVLLLAPVFFYLKKHEHGKIAHTIKKIMSNPFGLILAIALFIAEVTLVKPNPYELYAMTWHGFFLGLIAFLAGFCLVMSGPTCWNMLTKWRWLFLLIAAALFTYRGLQFQMRVPGYHLAIESNFWIFSVFAFGYRYLNQSSKTLRYLSEAAYPVYILHMIFLYTGSILIFPLDIATPIQFVLVLAFTITGCFASYELIRRVNILRPLIGLRMKTENQKTDVAVQV